MATELEKREKQEVKTTAAEGLTESGVSYSPDVDIYASENDVVFLVDLPGVGKGDVSIEIDETDTLVIRARNSAAGSEGPGYRQYQLGNFYRAFQLSNEYDKDKVAAALENGLLEVRIPKREEAKPKRIEIQA